MNKELKAIEALGYKHEAIQFFSLYPPCHVFKKVFGDNDRFAEIVYVDYDLIRETWTVRAVLRDTALAYPDEFQASYLTIEKLEAFLAFAKALEKGELDD